MITDYVKAGYPALLVRTHEQERFISSMLPQLNGRTAYTWDLVRGYRELGNGDEWQEADPYDLPNFAARGKEKAVWFLRNYHFNLKDPGIIQAIQNNLPAYKTKGITLGHPGPGRRPSPGTGAGGGGPGFSPSHQRRAAGPSWPAWKRAPGSRLRMRTWSLMRPRGSPGRKQRTPWRWPWSGRNVLTPRPSPS